MNEKGPEDSIGKLAGLYYGQCPPVSRLVRQWIEKCIVEIWAVVSCHPCWLLVYITHVALEGMFDWPGMKENCGK
jgi:hypothetical protein